MKGSDSITTVSLRFDAEMKEQPDEIGMKLTSPTMNMVTKIKNKDTFLKLSSGKELNFSLRTVKDRLDSVSADSTPAPTPFDNTS